MLWLAVRGRSPGSGKLARRAEAARSLARSGAGVRGLPGNRRLPVRRRAPWELLTRALPTGTLLTGLLPRPLLIRALLTGPLLTRALGWRSAPLALTTLRSGTRLLPAGVEPAVLTRRWREGRLRHACESTARARQLS